MIIYLALRIGDDIARIESRATDRLYVDVNLLSQVVEQGVGPGYPPRVFRRVRDRDPVWIDALTAADRCASVGLHTLGSELRELAERWERTS